jgi:hypothetical protein
MTTGNISREFLEREAYFGFLAIVLGLCAVFFLLYPTIVYVTSPSLLGSLIAVWPIWCVAGYLAFRTLRILRVYDWKLVIRSAGASAVFLMICFVYLILTPSYRQLRFREYPEGTSFACGRVGCPGATDYGWPFPVYSTFDPPIIRYGSSHIDLLGVLITATLVVIVVWALTLLNGYIQLRIQKRS